MATFAAVILRGRKHVRRDGTANVKVRINHRRTTAYISTDQYVKPARFRLGHLTGKGDDAEIINDRLRTTISRYYTVYLRLTADTYRMTAADIKRAITIAPPGTEILFHDFADHYMKELRDAGRHGTARALSAGIAHLRAYHPTLTFHQFDRRVLEGFTGYLRGMGIRNGVDNYLRAVRAVCREAMRRYNDDDAGVVRITKYPFAKFRFPEVCRTTADTAMTSDQLRVILRHEPRTPREAVAIDTLRMMVALAGINGKDLYRLQSPDRGYYVYHRAKTGRRYCLPVTAWSQKLPDFNAWRDSAYFIHSVNIGLRRICEAEALPLLTTNGIRHSWASIARNECGISKDDIALCLGHSDPRNRVTDVYIRSDQGIIDSCVRRVIERVEG